MPDLTIDSVPGSRQGVHILKLAGPFTLANIFEFQEIARTGRPEVLIVDLTGVPFMDSAALGALLGLHVSCQRDHRQYALTGVADRIKTMFAVAGVDSLLVTRDNTPEAEEEFEEDVAGA